MAGDESVFGASTGSTRAASPSGNPLPLVLPTGSINGMAKDKVTITLDRAKAAVARELVGVDSTSEVIDLALDRLVRAERLRADIAAYRGMPPTQSEVDLALLADTSGLADDTDWEALYADEPS
jgi:hypothetical protein